MAYVASYDKSPVRGPRPAPSWPPASSPRRRAAAASSLKHQAKVIEIEAMEWLSDEQAGGLAPLRRAAAAASPAALDAQMQKDAGHHPVRLPRPVRPVGSPRPHAPDERAGRRRPTPPCPGSAMSSAAWRPRAGSAASPCPGRRPLHQTRSSTDEGWQKGPGDRPRPTWPPSASGWSSTLTEEEFAPELGAISAKGPPARPGHQDSNPERKRLTLPAHPYPGLARAPRLNVPTAPGDHEARLVGGDHRLGPVTQPELRQGLAAHVGSSTVSSVTTSRPGDPRCWTGPSATSRKHLGFPGESSAASAPRPDRRPRCSRRRPRAAAGRTR